MGLMSGWLKAQRPALITLRVLITLAVILANTWAVAALAIDLPITWLRIPLALLLVGVLVTIIWRWWRSWLAPVLGAGCFALVLGWWLTLAPSADRDWQPDVAVMPSADYDKQDEQKVTVHGIRSCTYRSEFDYDVHYHDQTYDLGKLRTVDLFHIYWGSPSIAHTIFSFGFSDGSYLTFSIEARKEKGEEYSALRGFFRQFEIIYLVADERDLIGLRTNFRKGEDVYLYRLKMGPEEARSLLYEYLRRINELHAAPEWYNAVTGNCTTAIRMQRSAVERAPWDWRILLNGHLDELLYERKSIDTSMPLAELKQRSLINPKARAVGPSDDFSQRIRQGLTTPSP